MTRGLVVLAFLVALCGCAAPPPGTPQPQDYANGVEISIASSEPFFTLSMPEFVAESAAWPDLRDVAVFNGDAQPVPFARVDGQAPTAAATLVELRSFRLDSSDPSGSPRIEIDTRGDNVQLLVDPSRTPSEGAEYVLALQDATERPVERLLLAWADEPQSWRQSVTVSISSDLRTWTTVADNRPIMDLRAGDERLRHSDIAIDTSAPYASGRYWRMKFAPGFVPALTRVTAEIRGEAAERPGLVLNTTGSLAPDRSAIYTLSAPQPVWRLRITPAEVNSVLPLEIDGQGPDEEIWRPLRRTVAYRLNSQTGEQRSAALTVGSVVLKAIRLRPIGTSFSVPPTVHVERQLDVLVVNARGAGPFLLAWGSRSAHDAAIGVSTLVPGWNNGSLDTLPQGALGRRHTLGGPSRLTELSPAERTAQWQTTLVWVLLVGGAGGLGFLAWKVWRERAEAEGVTQP